MNTTVTMPLDINAYLGKSDAFCQQCVLATASPRRHVLAAVAGLTYVVRPADIDERIIDGETPSPYVERLAIHKGSTSATHYFEEATRPEATICRCRKKHLVISADTVVVHGNEIFGKASDRKQAMHVLSQLSGKTHHVLTGIAVHTLLLRSASNKKAEFEETTLVRAKLEHKAVIKTDVHMRPYTRHMIERYLDQNEWEGIAGSYTSQGAGSGLIARIEGSFSNVVGLPISHLLEAIGTIVGAPLPKASV